ncbi:ABC transporter permease [Plantactinospora endophytica]|uniref:Peptide ABC transporter n=1 Tax=Plantactinospora endophytica TaxID=673535 RepID=A0ABQ4EB56_9ACTN|nr:ABC transporter permease [Plantactinospora endophytica]GIG91972.1 peptide ABC transporter [Plantactinospora endophytica]
MLRVIGARLVQMLVVVLCVTALGFGLVNILQGNVVYAILGDFYTPEAAAELTAQLRLDDPLYVRYLDWLAAAVQGDFGTSVITHQRVSEAIWLALPPTVELLVGAQLVGITLALLTTLLSLRFRWADRFVTVLGLIGNSVPAFVVALMLIVVFATSLRMVSSIGWVDPATGGWGANLKAMIIPSVALGVSVFPEYMRVLRSEIYEQLEGEEYVTLARMKGLSQRRVLVLHVARNSVGGLITLIALTTGFLLSGVVIVEEVFSIPGIGRLVLGAINNRDATLLQGAIVLIAVGVVVANLVGELIQMRLDPRVRPGARRRARAG